jgi:hypothetical protein
MLDDIRMIGLVARRELRDQARDWRIMLPLMILTLAFPFLMNEVAAQAVAFFARYGTPLIAYRLVPFSVLIIGFFPITISLVVALESFVGEKERGTIEPLLNSPLANWHLYCEAAGQHHFPLEFRLCLHRPFHGSRQLCTAAGTLILLITDDRARPSDGERRLVISVQSHRSGCHAGILRYHPVALMLRGEGLLF